MGIQVQCNNKGCFKQNEAMLEKETDKVFCAECGGEIDNISHFFKIQLKQFGQFLKIKKPQKAFTVPCLSCKKTDIPKITFDNKVFCSICDEQITGLSAPFIQMLKLNIKVEK